MGAGQEGKHADFERQARDGVERAKTADVMEADCGSHPEQHGPLNQQRELARIEIFRIEGWRQDAQGYSRMDQHEEPCGGQQLVACEIGTAPLSQDMHHQKQQGGECKRLVCHIGGPVGPWHALEHIVAQSGVDEGAKKYGGCCFLH